MCFISEPQQFPARKSITIAYDVLEKCRYLLFDGYKQFVVTHPFVLQVHVLVQLALADLLAAATLMVATLFSKYNVERSVQFCPLGLPLALVSLLLFFNVNHESALFFSQGSSPGCI